jgi:hypothetical protein
LDSFFYWGSIIIVELAATFFMLKYRKKLPNPLGFVSNRVKSFAKGMADDYMSSILKDLQEHPEIASNLLKKPLELLLEDLVKNPPKGLADKVGKMEMTGDLLVDAGQIFLPMFGKKGQMAAQALPLLRHLKGRGEGNSTSKNPFDR